MNPRRHRRYGCMAWLWLAIAASLLATSAQAGQVGVRAFLDRNHAQLGDTVTLNVEVDGATQVPAPDVSALAADFQILGTSHNTSISIVNGKRSVKSLWAIALKPRHTGTLTIPALNVGGQMTRPLTLTVGAATTSAQGGPGDPVFIRVTPSTRTPYVDQQVDLVVRLFYSPNVASGSLDVPHLKGIDVRQLGKGSRYQAERGGRIYQVLEKHYALTAQHAGTLDLPPVTFTGNMAVTNQFTMFFGNGKSVAARSLPIHLAVRAKPAAAGKGRWLPARKLTLKLAGLPADGRVTAGQPLTLTLTEKAIGLPLESLPEPRLPKLADVDVYPDRSRDHTGDDGHWLVGTRTRKFALIPQRSGTLVIPAITLAWWNVESDHREVARIPAHTLHVLPGAAASNGQADATPALAASAAGPANAPAPLPHAAAPATPASTTPAATSVPALAWIALGLWVLTMLAALLVWWWWRRRHTVLAPGGRLADAPTRNPRPRHAFLEAVRQGDVAAQCEHLLAWARSERPDLQALGELAAALDSPAQRDAIAALQRARYGAAADGVDADAIGAAFRGGLAWRSAARPRAGDEALPPLYP